VSFVVAWAGVPLVLGLLGLGCGLLVERAAGRRLPGALLVPLGVAVVIVVSQMTTVAELTAPWTPWLMVALALAGLWLGRERLRSTRLDPWAAAAAAGAFAVLAAPVVLSGSATFAGYNVSGDISFQLIGIEYLLDHGHRMGVLPPSTYEFYAQVYYSRFYPAGAHTAAGVAKVLLGQNAAWIYHPYLCTLQALTALSLYALARTFVARAWIAAVIAFVAAQPALVIGYALQGQIKEVAAIAMLALAGALVADWARLRERRARDVVPLGVAAPAFVSVIGWAAGVWLAPLVLACFAVTLLGPARVRGLPAVRIGAAWLALFLLLVWPQYRALSFYFTPATDFLGNQGDLGNLRHPLSAYQTLGIWLTGDYRNLPHDARAVTYALLAVAIAGAAIGLLWALRRRAWPVVLFVAVNVVACLYLLRRGSPYADGKVFMIVAPAGLLAVMLGFPALMAGRLRALGVAFAVLMAGGVLVSNGLAYDAAALAPKARFAELERIGERLHEVGGRTLYTEFDEFDKFFLRDAQAEGASEAFKRGGSGLRPELGPGPSYGIYYDLEAFPVEYGLSFDNLVLRRGPTSSRPPAPFSLASRGSYYDVWRRGAGLAVAEHLPLGDRFQAGAEPRCEDVSGIAGRARAAGQRLAYVERPETAYAIPGDGPLPDGWERLRPDDPLFVVPHGAGRIERTVTVRAADTYHLWLQGTFRRELRVRVDGRLVGTVKAEQNGPEQFGDAGSVRLGPGEHRVELQRPGADLAPGDSGSGTIGPLGFERSGSAARVVETVDAAGWRALCGKRLDWIERVAP
jgi:hypothetical protein